MGRFAAVGAFNLDLVPDSIGVPSPYEDMISVVR
jgi:hypothetical protein